MLKHGVINPLNVFGLRQISHCPPHFEQVSFDCNTTEKVLTDWIYENLAGRFYIGQTTVSRYPDTTKSTFIQTLVAFETASEASYFSLFLPQINIPKTLW